MLLDPLRLPAAGVGGATRAHSPQLRRSRQEKVQRKLKTLLTRDSHVFHK
jgi:hypothetical protein